MRLSCRNHHDVTFLEVVGLAVQDVFRRHLSRPRGRGFNRAAAGDQRSAPIHDIKDVRLFFMNLDVSVGRAPVGLDPVAVPGTSGLPPCFPKLSSTFWLSTYTGDCAFAIDTASTAEIQRVSRFINTMGLFTNPSFEPSGKSFATSQKSEREFSATNGCLKPP
jgi:hypothetical protein